MPMYDFQCRKEGLVFERFVSYEKRDRVHCKCGSFAVRVWLKAPGVQGEENVDAAMMKAARSGLTYGTGDQPISPFTGSTRSELKAWMREHKLVAVEKGERDSRGVKINSKTKFTETPEYTRLHDKVMRDAFEIARSESAVAERFAQIEQPNEFDARAFAKQEAAGGAVIAANEQIKSAGPLVAEELATK